MWVNRVGDKAIDDSRETQGSGQQTFHSETETDLCSWNDWPEEKEEEEDTTDITEYFLLYIKRRGDNFKRHIFKEGFDYMHSLKIERRSWMDGRQQQQAEVVWAIKNLDSENLCFLPFDRLNEWRGRLASELNRCRIWSITGHGESVIEFKR